MGRSSEQDDPYAGKKLTDNYLVEDLLGVGAMGRVYKAEQVSLGKTVAVKILHRHLLGDPSLEKRFQREGRAAARLQHPNCINVTDFGKADDGSLFIAMEYLEGVNLGHELKETGPIPWQRAVHILGQVASALDEAHSQGVIHRDLKPENIVLEERRKEADFVKVLDFGIAKVKEADNRDGVLTVVGSVCGTPEYMSPEQARGDRDIDARTDIYSMGCILYQMLCGELPFHGESALAVVTKQLNDEATPPRERKPDLDIPPVIEALCLRALSKDPDGRPESASAFGRELKAAAVAATSPGPVAVAVAAEPVSPYDSTRAVSLVVDGDEIRTRSGAVAGDAVVEGRGGTDPTLAPGGAPMSISDPRVPTNPATPLHPTPMIAGEVLEEATDTVVSGGGRRAMVLAIIAVAAVVAVVSIWAVRQGKRPKPQLRTASTVIAVPGHQASEGKAALDRQAKVPEPATKPRPSAPAPKAAATEPAAPVVASPPGERAVAAGPAPAPKKAKRRKSAHRKPKHKAAAESAPRRRSKKPEAEAARSGKTLF